MVEEYSTTQMVSKKQIMRGKVKCSKEREKAPLRYTGQIKRMVKITHTHTPVNNK